MKKKRENVFEQKLFFENVLEKNIFREKFFFENFFIKFYRGEAIIGEKGEELFGSFRYEVQKLENASKFDIVSYVSV